MRKNLLMLILLGLIIASFVSAIQSPYELKFNYNETSNTSIFLQEMYYTQSILVNVNTIHETSCKWGYNNQTIANDFDTNYGTTHEIIFENLENGQHKYYIQCETPNKTIMEITFKTKTPIFAKISLSKESPLKKGIYEINLITSSIPSEKPKLEYSLDGLTYKPLPLTGERKNWRSQLLIDKNIGETIGSFKFEAKDLDGVIGTEIKQGEIFVVDTIAPGIIKDIDAQGKLGEIELSWYYDEDVKEYKIYKSENPGVDYTDYLENTEEKSFLDTDVKAGKTYYYKITAVDEAGNEGSLSREISATALLYKTQQNQTGLSQNLLGKVDNSLTEINLVQQDIQNIKNSIPNKEEKERTLFEDLGLNKDINSALNEISSLKKDVERYKLQDLTENELTQKLNQAKLKLNIIKKKVPESLTIEQEFDLKRNPTKQNIEEMTLAYGQEILTEKQQKKTISLSQELLKKQSISIQSVAYAININYLDGSSQEKTLVKDEINSELERNTNTRIFLLIPKEIVERASDLHFSVGAPEIIKSDPLLSFEADTKKIIYTINKKIDVKAIENINLVPLKISQETKTNTLTGWSISKGEELRNAQAEIIFVAVIIILVIVYFILKQKNKYSEDLIEIKELLKEAKQKKKENKKQELKEIYNRIKELYLKLSKKEKKKIYKKIQKIYND